jgi:hypothetical protein
MVHVLLTDFFFIDKLKSMLFSAVLASVIRRRMKS